MMRRYIAAIIAFTMCLSAMSPLSARAEGFFIRGDANGDGAFDTADLAALKKWLTGDPESGLVSPKAADLCRDNVTDVFDLVAMRRELISAAEPSIISAPVCRAAALVCADSGELLYGDNINERTAPASLTKLLTAQVALKYLSPETVITVGSEQSLVKSGSSLCLIQRGHRLRLYDLLTGMLMASGNDAAYTVAVAAARAANPGKSLSDAEAAAAFADMMNACAAEIGMTHSHFVSPEGWDDPQQYTTAADLLLLAQHSFSDPVIREITGTLQTKVYFVSGENAVWKNTNSLLDPESKFYCADAVGMKTGTTAAAGRCLIAAFQRGGKTYFTAVTGCRTDSARYLLTLQMLGTLS